MGHIGSINIRVLVPRPKLSHDRRRVRRLTPAPVGVPSANSSRTGKNSFSHASAESRSHFDPALRVEISRLDLRLVDLRVGLGLPTISE
jgi:hypothetical protein